MKKFLQKIGFIRENEYRGTLSKSPGQERTAKALSRKANFFTSFATIINIIGLVITARGIIVIASKNDRKEDTRVVKGTTVITKGISQKGILLIVSETLESLVLMEQRREERDKMEAEVNSPEADEFLKNLTKSINGGNDAK